MLDKISGFTSTLELYVDYLVIRPDNIQKLVSHTRMIPLDDVISVNIVKPFLKVPYLQVITPDLHVTKNDGLKAADANVVLIQPFNMKKAKKIREYIMSYKIGSIQRSKGISVSLVGSIDDLEKLARLKDSGMITQEEFNAKKKQILGL
ncbi:hypothetical protein PAESOLCIP111_04573 [Paenibacillus solanacearum]|uniref:SHOCT domain-containing protein n=1 Tax=Paenibacillus solanacearum TaxID=2048548 RepID=A0A916K660_9BACL|nr:SHOCT domain-containing protein [Paenibacillus solanacearum]CAG7643894.1 hypothetical protein PAESOLCIP111_04573 [Paenibacillus solanacearum]